MKIISYFLSLAVFVAFVGTGCNNAEYNAIDNSVYIANAAGISKIERRIVEGEISVPLVVRTARITTQDIAVKLMINEAYIEQYNDQHSASYLPLPAEFFEIETMQAVIPAGKFSFSVNVTLKELSFELNKSGRTYVLPLCIESAENMEILADSRNFMFALVPIPISHVPEFNNGNSATLYLAEDGPSDIFTFEFLIHMISPSTSNGNAGIPFAIWNTAAPNPGDWTQGVFSRFGDAGQPPNHINGNIRGRYDWPTGTGLVYNTWNHVAYTYDFFAGQDAWYHNGERILMREIAALKEYSFTVSKEKIVIGRNEGANNTHNTKLRYAEVRLWNHVRSTDQLKNNMYGVDPQTPGLVAYWRLDEGEGDVYKCSTGRNPDGVRVGSNPGIWHLNQRLEIGK